MRSALYLTDAMTVSRRRCVDGGASATGHLTDHGTAAEKNAKESICRGIADALRACLIHQSATREQTNALMLSP
jgi:hypothetical protein